MLQVTSIHVYDSPLYILRRCLTNIDCLAVLVSVSLLHRPSKSDLYLSVSSSLPQSSECTASMLDRRLKLSRVTCLCDFSVFFSPRLPVWVELPHCCRPSSKVENILLPRSPCAQSQGPGVLTLPIRSLIIIRPRSKTTPQLSTSLLWRRL